MEADIALGLPPYTINVERGGEQVRAHDYEVEGVYRITLHRRKNPEIIVDTLYPESGLIHNYERNGTEGGIAEIYDWRDI